MDDQTSALVIDDTELNREYYEAVLEQIGWSVVSAPDGHSGVDAFRSRRPALAMVDVRLPDLNGYQVVRQLRALAVRPTYIVLMSAEPSLLDHERGRLAGADTTLVGPLGISQLRSLLKDRADWKEPAPKDIPVASTRCKLQFVGSCRVWDGRRWRDLDSRVLQHVLAALVAGSPAILTNRELGRILAAAATAQDMVLNEHDLLSALANYGCSDAVVRTDGGFQLALERDNVDTLRFESRVRQLVSAALPEPEFIPKASALLDGALLDAYPQINSPLVDGARARLYELRAVLEEALATHLLMGNAVAEAILTLRRLTAREPWREGSWSLLMIALGRQGRSGDALDLYGRVRAILSESGVHAGPALQSTALMIRDGDPRLYDNKQLRAHLSGMATMG